MIDFLLLLFLFFISYFLYKKLLFPLREKEIETYNLKQKEIEERINLDFVLKRYLEYLIDEKNTKCKEYLESIEFEEK